MAVNLSKERRREVERRAWELRQRFWTLERIGRELGVDKGTISRALARVEARLAKTFEARAGRIKVRQTYQLEHVASEAMEQWERSKKDAETTKITEEGQGEEASSKTEYTVKGQTGDAGLLNQARGALADIRSIWGLEVAKGKEIGGQDSGPRTVIVHASGGTTNLPTGE